jgi:23S rRNA pseudouridine1911/1915/1917 synthase
MSEEEIQDQQELFEHHRFVVDAGQALLRIDKFLAAKLENTSRTRVQNAANAGNILVNNLAIKPNYRVKPGDVIQIVLPTPPREIELIPENIPINILCLRKPS